MILIFMMANITRVYAFDMPTGQTKMDKELKRYIEKNCREYNICPDLIIAMAERESLLTYDAISSAGCVGLLQISPEWHKERMQRLNVSDLIDPYQNAIVCIDYLSELFEKYEDIYAVLMFYNGGYGSKAGLNAYNRGIVSQYAIDIATRSEELERIRERERKIWRGKNIWKIY